MSAGLIPISTLVSGSEDLITPGINGFLAEIGSKESLSKAIKNAGTLTPEVMQQYSNNSFNIIREKYEIGIITNKYRELYHSMS
jgi:glycosyltransferase involved in cell wall biosynthesis